MKEEIVNKLGAKLLEYVSNTEDFLTTETPEFFKQLLEFEVIESYFIIGTLLLLTLLTTILTTRVLKKDWDPEIGAGIFLVTLVVVLTSAVVIPIEVIEIVKIKTAPKVFIVDYLKK